jgi:Phosphoesterase family
VPAMGGFVRNYREHKAAGGPDVMRCLNPGDHCPVLAGLAKDFAVCTAWFSSVPGETWPNRNFAHAATSDKATNIEFGFYVDRTIFELLEKAKRSWRIYFDGPPEVWFFRRLWRPRWLDLLPGHHGRLANWFQMHHFYDHVASGNLPAYSFIEPAHNHYFEDPESKRQTNSQHCHNNFGDDTASDFRAGEKLIGSVYDALVDNAELFAKTLLVITYDEHGGLYDHVLPGPTVDPEDPSNIGWLRRIGRFFRRLADHLRHQPPDKSDDFTHLGVRVPAILISPWIAPGRIVPDPLEHASIPATLRTVFAPGETPLTKRDEQAKTFHAVVVDAESLSSPRQPAPTDGSPPPDGALRRSIDYAPAVEHAAVASPDSAAAFTPTPTTFDEQLFGLGQRVGRRLQTSRGVGVLRVGKVRATRQEAKRAAEPAHDGVEPDIEASQDQGPVLGDVGPAARPSVAGDSALDVFIDSTHVARRASTSRTGN